MEKIKIAQLGIGHNHAADKMHALRALPDHFEVVGVAESDPRWLQERGQLSVYQGLPWFSEENLFRIPGLQAVAVETDGAQLVPAARRCAAHGLHIHLDKPGGESLPEFAALLQDCRDRDLALQLAYVYRYNPGLNFCLRAVREGWLGQVFEVHAVMSRYDGDNQRYRTWLSQFRGGAMYIFAGYLVDLVVSMLGAPQQVVPFMQSTRADGLIDNGLAVLVYPQATATIRVSVEEVDGMKHRRLIVCGTLGSVELCPIEPPGPEYYTRPLQVRLTLKHDTATYSAGTHSVDCGTLNDRYDRQLLEFASIIRGEIANPYPYQHELLVHQTLLQAAGYQQ
ncbi:MAG: Gfo/Idh/MocA family oxidoreductase [Oligosphaeraceae bacterium]|nr:Gfo/Idh/MocA family oxidoreductase [Oligosphaeraceae bacterium]